MPKVSVVMAVYNGEKDLAAAIDSILSQTLSDFEFLIVDDGSHDSSAAIIQSYAERDRRIRFFPLERNIGQGDARNVGFFAARGEFVAGMDHDDISLPQRLEQQAAILQSRLEVGAVGTAYRVVRLDQARAPYEISLPTGHALIVFYRYFRLTLCGASVMYRRDILQAAGGNSPGIRRADDLALQQKLLWEQRITFANLPEVHYIYRIHEQTLSEIDAKDGFPHKIASRRAMVERLLGEGQEHIVPLLSQVPYVQKMSWAERRELKQALTRIADALIDHGLIDASDRPLLRHAINRRLEKSSPRRWRQFCHWRRYRLPALYPDLLKSEP